jgi:aryl-alcohol dehydrogenase-like predicted oxidoreductase
MNRIPGTDLDVHPLCLGGNVFGWTADEPGSQAVLDDYYAAGGNFVDTADVYSAWAPGNAGGESEAILGRWMQARRNRPRVVVATKVGMGPGLTGLAPKTIRAACEASLGRLRTDRIDLYYAHKDDPATPLEDIVRAFDALVREGKVRHVAASNFTASRLTEAIAIAKREGLARFVAIQPHYNLVTRADYETDLAEACSTAHVGVLPYYSLAKGFLTGKYREGQTARHDSPRAAGAVAYFDARGRRILAEVLAVAKAHATPPAAVALAWLRTRPNVVAPIASARTTEQLAELLPMARLVLGRDEIERLTTAGD